MNAIIKRCFLFTVKINLKFINRYLEFVHMTRILIASVGVALSIF